jgi:hypothetical protein
MDCVPRISPAPGRNTSSDPGSERTARVIASLRAALMDIKRQGEAEIGIERALVNGRFRFDLTGENENPALSGASESAGAALGLMLRQVDALRIAYQTTHCR